MSSLGRFFSCFNWSSEAVFHIAKKKKTRVIVLTNRLADYRAAIRQIEEPENDELDRQSTEKVLKVSLSWT